MPYITWKIDRKFRPIFGKADKQQCFLLTCDFCSNEVALSLDIRAGPDYKVDEVLPNKWQYHKLGYRGRLLCNECVSRILLKEKENEEHTKVSTNLCQPERYQVW